MASKVFASTALLLSFNLIFFTLVSSTYVPCPPTTSPTPKPQKPHHKPPQKYPPANPTCPRDTLKLGVCADVLGLVNVVVGSPPTLPCCALLDGLVDLEAAVCLCTAIKANVLGIDLNIGVSVSLVLDACGKTCPSDFICA
ncbi:14 kDa proline-rich protein DC2.15-like [Aristolochia californica]|uniref:14 kDa proline-rich protein DC2.15-like n=1 Tax=Aristolochia californica TaxID=171875 RepID=UPI0035DBF0A8